MTSRDRDSGSPSTDDEDDPVRSLSDLVDAVEERQGAGRDDSDGERAETGPGEAGTGRDGAGWGPGEAAAGPDSGFDADPGTDVGRRSDPGADADPGAGPSDGDEATGFSALREETERRRSLSEWEWVQFGSDAPRYGGEPASDPRTDALLELLGDARNVLLDGPLLCPAEYEACSRLLGASGPEPTNALVVSFTQSADDRLDACRGYLGDGIDETVVLSVGDRTRSSAAPAVQRTDTDLVTIEAIPNPGNLVGIGMTISRYLSDWKDEDARAVVCFHSLTALLRFADDLRSVFRFLHVLQSHVRATGARAHYHVESDAHDGETLSTIRPLFDVTLQYDADEPISVRW